MSLSYNLLLSCLRSSMDLMSLHTWFSLDKVTPWGKVIYTSYWTSPCKKELFTLSLCFYLLWMKLRSISSLIMVIFVDQVTPNTRDVIKEFWKLSIKTYNFKNVYIKEDVKAKINHCER